MFITSEVMDFMSSELHTYSVGKYSLRDLAAYVNNASSVLNFKDVEETRGRKPKSGHKKTSRQAGSFVVDSDERPTFLRL